jgi:SAM-dependent methyltransferase
MSLAGRMLTDGAFRTRAVRFLLGLPTPLDTVDRKLLEQVVFEYFVALPDVRSVLFVGCDWYTRHYEREFFSSTNYWTIDPAASARRFGARQHIVAPLEELDRHFPHGYFDLILCNGVYGYGLNTRQQCEQAFAQCYSRLGPGGYFVLGWDDSASRTPVLLEEIESLRAFDRFVFPPLGAWRYTTDTAYRHTYDFYFRSSRRSIGRSSTLNAAS